MIILKWFLIISKMILDHFEMIFDHFEMIFDHFGILNFFALKFFKVPNISEKCFHNTRKIRKKTFFEQNSWHYYKLILKIGEIFGIFTHIKFTIQVSCYTSYPKFWKNFSRTKPLKILKKFHQNWKSEYFVATSINND